MARFNEILVGHFNRGLQKLLGIKGEVPAPQISSEIMPVIQLPLGVEHLFLDGWNRYGITMLLAATAAQFGTLQLRNPVGSNVLIVVEKLVAQSTAGLARAFIGAVTTDLATLISTSIPLDNRNTGRPAGILSQATLAALNPPGNAQVIDTGIAGRTEFIVDSSQHLVVAPGAAVGIQDPTANEPVNAVLWWRERYLEESERT